MGHVRWAVEAFNRLNGVFCVYKPISFQCSDVVRLIKRHVLKDLNALPAYDHEIKEHEEKLKLLAANKEVDMMSNSSVPAKILPSTKEPKESRTKSSFLDKIKSSSSLSTDVDYSKHRLVLGDMFLRDDIEVSWLHALGPDASGVLVCGIGALGLEFLKMVSAAKYLRVYHVKGRFGYATDNFFTSGKFIERTTYYHISKGKLDKVCSAAQYGHQRLMFKCAGVDPSSQKAYDLASQGILRPANKTMPPILYGVKCIDFNLPDFTLEIHAINEFDNYLAELINDIGIQLKSTAVCTHIHRLRYGHFTLADTLLNRDWYLEPILKNMEDCKKSLTVNNLLTSKVANSKYESQDFPKVGDGARTEPDAKSMIKSLLNNKLKDAKYRNVSGNNHKSVDSKTEEIKS